MRANGIAAFALIGTALGLTACNQAKTDAQGGETGESACSSKATQDAVKKALFDGAVEKFDGEPLAINDMRRSAKAKLDYAEVEKVDDQAGITDCSARLKIAIPVGVQEKFGGEDELLADVTYTTRKAEDGSGRAVEVAGLDFAVGKIVDAFSGKLAKPEPKPEPKPAPKPEPRVATFKPSFNCGGKLTRVERMICTDPVLAQLDRQMANYYYRALEAPQSDRTAIRRGQRNWLKAISACENTACVERTQRARIDFLRNNF